MVVVVAVAVVSGGGDVVRPSLAALVGEVGEEVVVVEDNEPKAR